MLNGRLPNPAVPLELHNEDNSTYDLAGLADQLDLNIQYPARTASVGGSAHVKTLCNYDWKSLGFSYSNQVDVHRNGNLVAYAMRLADGKGSIKVVRLGTADGVLLKGFEGIVRDLAFSRDDRVLLAGIDVQMVLVVFSIDSSSSAAGPGGGVRVSSLSHRCLVRISCRSSPAASLSSSVSSFADENETRILSWCWSAVDYDEDDDYVDEDMSKRLCVVCNRNAWVIDFKAIVNMDTGRDASSSASSSLTGSGSGAQDLPALCPVDEFFPLSLPKPLSASITAASISPDGKALALSSLDGCIHLYSEDDDESDSPLFKHIFEWRPHNGKPVTYHRFLDNCTKSAGSFWNYCLSASVYNSEFAIYDCQSWQCIQRILFTPQPDPSIDHRPSARFKVVTDLTSSHLIVSNMTTSMLYIVSLDSGENSKCLAKSITEFCLAQPVLSMVVLDTETVTDYDDDGVSKSEVEIKLLAIQPKSLQQLAVNFEPLQGQTSREDLEIEQLTTSVANNRRSGAADDDSSPVPSGRTTPFEAMDRDGKDFDGDEDYEVDEADGSDGSDEMRVIDHVGSDGDANAVSNVNGSLLRTATLDDPVLLTPNAFGASSSAGAPVAAVASQLSSSRHSFDGSTSLNVSSSSNVSPLANQRSPPKGTKTEAHCHHSPAAANLQAMSSSLTTISTGPQSPSAGNGPANVTKLGPSDAHSPMAASSPASSATTLVGPQVDSPSAGANSAGISNQLGRDLDQKMMFILHALQQLSVNQNDQWKQLQTLMEENNRRMSMGGGAMNGSHRELSAKMETLLNARAQQFERKLLDHTDKAINQMHQTLQNEVQQLRSSIQEEVSRQLTATNALIKDHIVKQFKQRSTYEQLSQSAMSVIQPALINEVQAMFAKDLVPSFNKSLQLIFEHVDHSFAKGTQHYVGIAEQNLQKMQTASLEESRRSLRQLTDQLETNAQSLVNASETAAKSSNEQTGQLVDRLETRLNDRLSLHETNVSQQIEQLRTLYNSTDGAMPNSSLSGIGNSESGTAAARRSTAVTPSPTIDEVKAMVDRLLVEGRINDAFERALSACNLDLVMWLCRRSERIFAQSSLTQPVLLSLIWQLVAKLDIDTDFKINCLQEAFDKVIPSDRQNNVSRVMRACVDKIDQALQTIDPSRPAHRQLRMLRRLAFNMITS